MKEYVVSMSMFGGGMVGCSWTISNGQIFLRRVRAFRGNQRSEGGKALSLSQIRDTVDRGGRGRLRLKACMITALAEAFENIDTFLLQIMKNINSDANKQLKKKKENRASLAQKVCMSS